MRRRLGAGSVIADRYQLEEPIGAGGMGEVWRAQHTRLGSPVAVKLLREGVADDGASAERFVREARACASIRGPHIVEILDFGVEDETPYIAMELLVGESLGARLARETRLTPTTIARIFQQIGRAVGRAHRAGIVHRDLKPSNVHLVRDEDDLEDRVKVLDFGIAKLLGGELTGTPSLTGTGALVGTVHYMSPEQARGTKEVDHRADLWALAILAFQCVTGELPVRGKGMADVVIAIHTLPMPKPSAVFPGAPPGFDAWFARGSRRAPEDRFQSAAELVQELVLALGVG